MSSVLFEVTVGFEEAYAVIETQFRGNWLLGSTGWGNISYWQTHLGWVQI